MAASVPPAPGSRLRLRFTEMAYGGDVVARDPESGLVVYAWPGIEGEEASVEVTEARRGLLRGVVAQVHTPSPDRAQPPCPVYGTCGGCQLQHMDYLAQVAAKSNILATQLARIAGIHDPPLQPPVVSPRSLAYRNSSHFAVDPETRTVGYFRRGSHSIVPVDACPISNGGINGALPAVNELLSAAAPGSAQADETKGLMTVWKVSVRSSDRTGHTVVVFHTRARAAGRAAARNRQRRGRASQSGTLAEELQSEAGPNPPRPQTELPEVTLSRRELRRAAQGLLRSMEPEGAAAWAVVELMDDGTLNFVAESRSATGLSAEAQADLLSGISLQQSGAGFAGAQLRPPSGAWVEQLGGLTYWVAPAAFFQVNTECAELLVAEVAAAVGEQAKLLVDAYCGVGTFTLALASRCEQVIGFESETSAVAGARWNAAAQGMGNVEFRRGPAEELLPRLPRHIKPDVVVLDPPRSGCHPALLTELLRREAPLVIYVSCDPSTLARDLKTLVGPYELTGVRAVDMFPQTFHLESVTVLRRR